MSVWNFFKYRYHNTESKEQNHQITKFENQIKFNYEQMLKNIAKKIQSSQQKFREIYQTKKDQQSLSEIFEQMIATLGGLVSMVEELRKQYQQFQTNQQQYLQLKNILTNHQSIIKSIQDSYSGQITNIYNEKNKINEELSARIQTLIEQKQQNKKVIAQMQGQISKSHSLIQQLSKKHQLIQQEKKNTEQKYEQLKIKYNSLFHKDELQYKKVINWQKITLQNCFYYQKMRNKIISYLDYQDIIRLKQTCKYFNMTIKKQQSKYILNTASKKFTKKIQLITHSNQLYDKILDNFPIENIKVNAFKYLHFKIKPATYILPYLQEQYKEQQAKESPLKNDKGNKFNWKSIFSSQKKVQKKQQSKFSINQLKNEEQYKRIESKIEQTFKNVLSIKMPEDFKYFIQSMQSQFSQLKLKLHPSKSEKLSIYEWTSQLHCLSKYMYFQINQIYSLLQVIFNELIIKTKQLVALSQKHQYLSQNETILRNLIQSISKDKNNLQKKYFMIENDLVTKKLQKQHIINQYNQQNHILKELTVKYDTICQENVTLKKYNDKFQQQKRVIDINLNKIREQIQNLNSLPLKHRKQSFNSVSSEQQV